MRVRPPGEAVPPFFVQCTDNWVLLSILPVLEEKADEVGLHRRLLLVTRSMHLAKFALGHDDEVVLCAELPTESLDRSELQNAVTRMVAYFRRHRDYLATGLPAAGEARPPRPSNRDNPTSGNGR